MLDLFKVVLNWHKPGREPYFAGKSTGRPGPTDFTIALGPPWPAKRAS